MSKNRKFHRMVAVAVATMAAAPAVAPARPDFPLPRARHAAVVVAPPVVRVVTPAHSTGFDWGDAGIGAGSAIAIALLLSGVVLLVGRRRHGLDSTGPSALAG